MQPIEPNCNEVLVVQISVKDVDLAELRDYIVDSLSMGVLVLGQGVTWKLERFPDLGGVQVRRAEGLRGEKPELPTKRHRSEANEKAEKDAITTRLREFRKRNGLGCLNVLAQKCGSGGITADVLRDVINGAAVLPMASWRRIGKALDRVANQQEGGDGKGD